MGEGEILVRVSPLFLYCKYLIFRGIASDTGELGDYARRLLALDRTDAEDPEQVKTVHSCMAQKGGFDIRGQYHRDPAMIRKPDGCEIQDLTI